MANEFPEATARRSLGEMLIQHHAPSIVSVIEFSDLASAFDSRLAALREACETALKSLESEHVGPNLFRLGLLGKQELEFATAQLRAALHPQPEEGK